jgi:hypothetical protein
MVEPNGVGGMTLFYGRPFRTRMNGFSRKKAGVSGGMAGFPTGTPRFLGVICRNPWWHNRISWCHLPKFSVASPAFSVSFTGTLGGITGFPGVICRNPWWHFPEFPVAYAPLF